MDTILLATDYNIMWTVTFAGISIVFLVLAVLVLIFYLFGFIMQKFSGSSNKGAQVTKKSNSKPGSNATVNAPKAPPAIKVIDDGISPEVVAAISAAIAFQNDGNQYTIRSIKKHQATVGRPAWSTAGVVDNTRPF